MVLSWSSRVRGKALLPLSMINPYRFVVVLKITGMVATRCGAIDFVGDA